jgi:signal transduction histidine kinase
MLPPQPIDKVARPLRDLILTCSRLPDGEGYAVYIDDDFLATLNHEIRGPLAPLAFGIEILKMKAHCDEKTLAMMERQVERLRTVLKELCGT